MIIAIRKETLFEFLKNNGTLDTGDRILFFKDWDAVDEYRQENRYMDAAANLDDYVAFEIKELPL